ncbi:cytochrome c [bacterium BMS3Abin12]|nr:cytochrome c [bacterium BMS3Abin12]GBE49239.1 cytochrome c [bacterium BMS3Bbin13]
MSYTGESNRMKKTIGITLASAASVLFLAGALTGTAPAAHAATDTTQASVIAAGKKLAFSRKKGNCLACHQIDDGKAPGNIGPPLVHIKERYPDFAKLRAQIWDATANYPKSIMPPFGRNRILTNKEIDEIAAYIYTQ